MNYIIDRYADVILGYALRLRKGDVLSINTEEANSDIAHLIAKKAKALTGNGTYIQYIENGKVTEKEEAETDFPIGLSPTAMLHLPVFRFPQKPLHPSLFPFLLKAAFHSGLPAGSWSAAFH